MAKSILKQDKYGKVRGGYSRLMEIKCSECRALICCYQKDGAGPLKRLYADRILQPRIPYKAGKKLLCKKCKMWLGASSIYKKEYRRCFILFQGAVQKRMVKL